MWPEYDAQDEHLDIINIWTSISFDEKVPGAHKREIAYEYERVRSLLSVLFKMVSIRKRL